MEEHFNTIKETYDTFYKFLLVKHGMFPVKDTGVGYWGVSASTEIFELFKKINLHKFKHLLDLGSGDGKAVMIASLFTNATGVEFDPWLVDVSNDIKNKLFHIPHTNRAKFIKGDFMEHDLSAYDIIFMNPDNKSLVLNDKLKSEFKGKVVVYGPHYHPEGLEKEDTFDIGGTLITIYNSN